MRVLVAPDGFGGTLTAVQAAEAIACGWTAAAPGDTVTCVPLSDGGPGLVPVLAARLGGQLIAVGTTDALDRSLTAEVLVVGDTAYVESAAACGLHRVEAQDRRATQASTAGVGTLVAAALDRGVSRLVIGLGGSATSDGGSGALASLGLVPVDRAGQPLPPGGAALRSCHALVGALDPRLADVEIVVASDVTAPLLGVHGAASVFGPQKGASRADVLDLDDGLRRWADVLEGHLGVAVRDQPGAGAAGGLGAALLALGARLEPGLDLVADLVDLRRAVADAHLVVTGEGAFDATSLLGKAVVRVAALAAEEALPCLVLAGQVSVGRREAAAAGIEATYALADAVGVDAAMADPAAELTALAARVAREWSR